MKVGKKIKDSYEVVSGNRQKRGLDEKGIGWIGVGIMLKKL